MALVFLILAATLYGAGLPGAPSDLEHSESAAPLEFSAQNAWIVVPRSVNGLTLTSGTTEKSMSLQDLYLQRSLVGLTIRPTATQQLRVQIPVQYTYDLVGDEDYTSAWTLGDARAIWVSLWSQKPSWELKTITGLLLPSSTRGSHVYLISDLDGLPRSRIITPHQGPDGADVVRLLIGLTPSFQIPVGQERVLTWSTHTALRQPLGSGASMPFTLVDWEMSWNYHISPLFGLLVSAGQTRGWFPKGLLDPDIPSASFTQLSLLGRLPSGLGYHLGMRWNPLANQEKEPYAIRTSSTRLAEIEWAVEPAFQWIAGLTYAWNPAPLTGEGQTAAFADKDHDGISNKADHCPDEPEDLDGFRDQDGCPEFDNDHDHVKDLHDLCPNEAEDMDGFNDQDGCPELDNDRDGIPDVRDRCPDEAENKDRIQDDDGCPDRDSDRDGIEDSQDKCPTVKETFNFFLDKDGCPDEKPERVSRQELKGIQFDFGAFALDSSGLRIVGELSEKMKLYPATFVEITGHADPTEPDPVGLGLNRAQAISNELKRLGVQHDRIKTLSLGSEKPIASNQSARGRSKNRRVELVPK